MLTQSRLSTKFVQVKVGFTVAGVPQNPTGDVVQMAFMDGGAIPVSGDWQTASWETVGAGISAVYYAECLVGPAGGVVLPPGVWTVYVRVTDNPEVPAEPAAQLTIT
jgi:hypothetical protein